MEEKIKLVSLNENQWHYKLIKFVFGKMLPDPKTLKNLCPYFWILVAALIVVLPVLPFKLIAGFFRLLGKGVERYKKSKVNRWLHSLSPFEAFDLYMYSDDGEIINRPKEARDKYYDSDLLNEWAKGLGLDPTAPDYDDKLREVFKGIKEERARLMKEQREFRMARQKRNQELREKRERRDEKIHATMNKVGNLLKPLAKIGNSVRGAFQFDNYGKIIKATKRFVGLVVTLFIAGLLVYVAQLATWGVLELIAIWSWSAIWYYTWMTLAIIGVLGVLFLIGWGIYALIKNAAVRYNNDETFTWYSIPFVYLAIGLYYILKYLVYYPGYFIFFVVLWKLICVSLVWGIFKGLGRGFAKFGGIFAEYFGASYTDFCPGVEWEEKK